ncbi:MAG: sigma-54-dependent Fis family transcriptional regulator [Polyangiaceae bacterium]
MVDDPLRAQAESGGADPPRDTALSAADAPAALLRVGRERDLLRKLVELGDKDEIEPFLEEALSLVVDITGAKRAYLEIRDNGADPAHSEPAVNTAFWLARGCSEEDVAAVRAQFSSGVIAHALAAGQTIATSNALLDPRFRTRGSVRANRLEAIVCAPIGASPPLGVVYLQDRGEPGPFSDEDRAHVELIARRVAPSPIASSSAAGRRRRGPNKPSPREARASSIVGRSLAVARLLQELVLVAPLDISVLLTGPTGSGKTAVARIVHENSPRADRPFVEINCGALPDSLLESELFGALPGAHSTAGRRVQGKVEAAHGGTLFLDEIGELSPAAQVKLLQLLQSKEYYPLGASRASTADVRILAATNADLRAAVAKKTFREDLFYRLQVLPIRVPSLAERREDIPELAAHFCKRAVDTHRLPALRLSPGALHALENAEWPGNVRELAHVVEAATIRAAAEGVLHIERKHLFPDTAAAPEGDPDSPADFPVPAEMTLQAATRWFQSRLVRRVLEDTGWNVTEAASRLDVARSHVYNLIRAFGLGRGKGHG